MQHINTVLRQKEITWGAGRTSVSEMTYMEKKNLFGGELPNLAGFDYYIGGIYVMQGYKPDTVLSLKSITSLNYTDADIVCEDRDGDGYYYWGIGPKPATCPCWAPNEPDGDDSNPYLGPMDEYGNCTPTVPLIDTITTSQTWNTNDTIYKKIIISSGITLTVTGTVFCSDIVNIIVQPGGKLIINGGLLTTIDCSNKLWQGITVMGDPNLPLKPQYQGSLEVINNGTIENAHCGVTVNAGGMIKCTDANFVNNTTGVYLKPQSAGGSFTRCNFELNNNYFGESTYGNLEDFDTHIKAQSSGSVYITGCDFSSTAPNNSTKNTGISTFDTWLSVREFCSGYLQPNSGICANINDTKMNTFIGLKNAISSSTSGMPSTLGVRLSSFKDNNANGIYINGTNYPTIIKNEFIVNKHSTCGLSVNNSTGYKIEENTFTDTQPVSGKVTTGTRITKSGIAENEIYKNEYNGLYFAQQFMGVNSSHGDTMQPIMTGLQTLCNEFKNSNTADILVGDLSIKPGFIRDNQGSQKISAGNKFWSQPLLHIDNIFHQTNYYWNAKREYPNNVTNNVIIIQTFNTNTCPSKIGLPQRGNDINLAQYDEWNEQYEYWLAQWNAVCGKRFAINGKDGKNESGNEECENILQMVSYYSALKDNYFNGLIATTMNEEVEDNDGTTAAEHWNNLRFLFNYRGHYTDYLCIVETYLAEKNFDEAFAILSKIYKQFELTEKQVFELKGLELYVNWLRELEATNKNIYELSEAELLYLVNYVKTNMGRGTVFAKNILCELYEICFEDAAALQMPMNNDDSMIENQSKSTQSVSSKFPNNALENITLYPNPTTGELTITSYELQVSGIEVFDIYGRKLLSQNSNLKLQTVINISHLQAGIYFVKIFTEQGEVIKKVVKQ